ncbi:hypothetical protein QQ045_002997 [Rhodiola kirilowii]
MEHGATAPPRPGRAKIETLQAVASTVDVVEHEAEQGSEEQMMEMLGNKIIQMLKVPAEGSEEGQRVSPNSLSQISLVPDTPHVDGGVIEAEDKEISPNVEGDTSSVLEISESIVVSNDSIELEELFIEVKRKMKKKKKKRGKG